MGWLFGNKDDKLYRGDAPASVPGYDGVEPTAYSPPNPAAHPNPAVAVPPNVSASAGVAPEFAAAMAIAQSQQQVARRTVSRSLFGFLLPLLLVGGLVVVGFVVVDKLQEGIENPFGSGAAPREPYEGVVGTPGEVILGDNSYRITIESATAQPSAAWGSIFGSESGGFLVVELSLTRTDTNASVSQISWYDWTFTPESGAAVEGALIAGGYEPLLSTVRLAPDETASGLVAFDTTASVGTLSLTTYDGAWAQWPISATVPAVTVGTFGVPVQPGTAGTPFSVTVANPRWIAAGDPAAIFDPESGTYLVVDMSITVDAAALAALSSVSVGYRNWQFTPDGGAAVEASFGVAGTNSLTFAAGLPTTANALLAFDVAQAPGELSLVNGDGSVLATWAVP